MIIFDEFDAIVPCRNSGQASVTDRIVNQFLCYLDGVEDIEGVFVVAITARPDLIDPAVIRPGRIDQHLRCNIPDRDQRAVYFKTNLGLVNVEEGLLEAESLEELVDKTEGFSFGNLVGVLRALQVDTFTKLADFERLVKEEAGKETEEEEVDQDPQEGELKKEGKNEKELVDGKDSEEYSRIGLKDVLLRIEEVERIADTDDYKLQERIYDKFEKGETYKPNYERQKMISK